MERKVILMMIVSCICLVLNAQNFKIEEEVKSYINGGCNKSVNTYLLNQNPVYSIELLNKYRSDTLKCIDKKVYETTCQLFNIAKNKNEIVNYLLLYISDSMNLYSGYIINCIYERANDIELDTVQLKKLSSIDLYKYYTRKLPLLLAYFEFEESTSLIKKWIENIELSEYDRDLFNVAAARLGDEESFNEINKKIETDSEWLIYFDHLNFIRNKKSTEKLIEFLSNNQEIVLERSPDVYRVDKCKLSALALYHLSMFIEDFPIQVSYIDLYFDLSEKVQTARKWFKDNQDYKIHRKLEDFKL